VGGKRVTIKEQRRIVMLLETGRSHLAIGKIVGRPQQTISRIANGQTMAIRTRLVTTVPLPVAKLLGQAAERRQMSASDLAAQLLGGIILRGSIDRTLQKWNAYENQRKLGSCDSHGSAERRNRAGEAENGSGRLTRAEV
jgi:hypothetical protein